MTDKNAEWWIEKLQLQQHIEGGYYKETYRADMVLPKESLADGHKGDRAASTGIYFLLQRGGISTLHRIASDEMWHYYSGGTLAIYEIAKSGELKKHLLGSHIEKGENLQLVIPAGSWFGARVEGGNYVLCGCTVAPAFDFEDFELATKVLAEQYPQHTAIINELIK